MAEFEKKHSLRRSLAWLRGRILDGGFEAGERLSEPRLASEIGVSRTPLREAMIQLVEEGLLERLPSGGCRVRRLTRANVEDSIELRGTLEGLALRMAAERGADADRIEACCALLGHIDAALGDGPDQTDFAAYSMLNAALHTAFAGLGASVLIEDEIARIVRLPLAGPSAFLMGQSDQPRILRSLIVAQAQHRAMIDAVVRREGARAEALAREHARLALRNLDEFLSADTAQRPEIPGLKLVQNTDGGHPS